MESFQGTLRHVFGLADVRDAERLGGIAIQGRWATHGPPLRRGFGGIGDPECAQQDKPRNGDRYPSEVRRQARNGVHGSQSGSIAVNPHGDVALGATEDHTAVRCDSQSGVCGARTRTSANHQHVVALHGVVKLAKGGALGI